MASEETLLILSCSLTVLGSEGWGVLMLCATAGRGNRCAIYTSMASEVKGKLEFLVDEARR